ncbi:hypothetical protein OH77DRAFT_1438987 [Trametes cingulata]|nr:hypothetical protein OH77DRAFT_1438987 [Trametes cingulata]
MHPPPQITDPFLRNVWSGMSDESRAILLGAMQAPGTGSSTASGSQGYGGPAIEPASAGSLPRGATNQRNLVRHGPPPVEFMDANGMHPHHIEEPFLGMGNTAPGGRGGVPFAGPGPLAPAADTASMNVLMSCLTQLSANVNELASTVARNNLRLDNVTTQITAGNTGSSAGVASASAPASDAGPTTSNVPDHEGPRRGANTGPFAVRGRYIRPARGRHRAPTGDDLVIAKTTTNKLSAAQRCARTEILGTTLQEEAKS